MSLQISKPTLIVSEKICRQNIQKMVEKAKCSGADFRPHFKTHQSADVGKWFREEGVSKITVSSVEMATYFSENGWDDITIAFPYNPLESNTINDLAKRVRLNVLIESEESLHHLNENVSEELGYFIKIDIGTGRTGITPENFEVLSKLKSKNPEHKLKGVLGHAGHSYKKLNKVEAQSIYANGVALLQKAKKELGDETLIISYGDTPTCSLLEKFEEVDELRPGNFAFYDSIQAYYGSCSTENIAVCMACPVVAKHVDRNEIVIYGGGVHFSKDRIDNSDSPFGTVVTLTSSGWETCTSARFTRMSQEHGILSGSDEFVASIKIGDIIGILPVHSCLAADLQGSFLSLEGQKLSKLKKE
jgi:D-serine deaminase-like pyridoxal phosphate-dependent protein